MTDTKTTTANTDPEATQEVAQEAMFSMAPKKTPEEKKKDEAKTKQDTAKKKADEDKAERERKKKEEENRVYPAGTEIHYINHHGRDKIELEADMKRAEVFEFLQEDFPELSPTRAEFRWDEKRGRIVVQSGAMTKGARS